MMGGDMLLRQAQGQLLIAATVCLCMLVWDNSRTVLKGFIKTKSTGSSTLLTLLSLYITYRYFVVINQCSQLLLTFCIYKQN